MKLLAALIRALLLALPTRAQDIARPNIIVPFLSGTVSPSPTQSFHYFRNDVLHDIREGRWKLRLADPNQPPELFDLEVDPSEQDNVADRHPDLAARLRERMRDFEPAPG